MKALTLAKPLVIIMIGVPGAGKSFFARQFSEDFGAPHICFDRLQHEIFPETSYSKDELDVAERVAQCQLEELLKTKQSCVFDGGGNSRNERIALAKKAKQAGYDTLIIWVQTDASTARQRSLKRSSRREDDKYNISLAPEQFESFSKQLTAPHPTEATVVISGKHTYLAQLKSVLKKIAQPRHDETAKVPQREEPPKPRRRTVLIR